MHEYSLIVVAFQIVEVLTESLTLKETPIPTKVARLMLVSDILHNSSAPVKNAAAFRTKFEASLPDVMESFNDLYRSITGRITAEALKVIYIALFLEYLSLHLSLFLHDCLNYCSAGEGYESSTSVGRLVLVF